MTSDEIIKMAQAAGMPFRPLDSDYCDLVGLDRGTICRIPDVGIAELERFYALAVAAEREACAKVAEAQGTSSGDRIAEAIRARSST